MRQFASLALAGLLATSATGNAATPITTSFQVKVQILDSCAVATPATLDFGAQTALNVSIDGTTSVAVTCSLATPYTVSLDAGTHGTGVADRKMRGATSDTISYGLYSDLARTSNWGNISGSWISGIGLGVLPTTHTIYGRIPSQTTPRPDTYTDMITVTVSY
jgi:spore coat protein U-like protein